MSLAILLLANLPPGFGQVGTSNDKLDHFLGFVVLTFAALWAFPNWSIGRQFALLGCFAALIEVGQALISNGREPDLLDFGAGLVAILLVVISVSFLRWWFPSNADL